MKGKRYVQGWRSDAELAVIRVYPLKGMCRLDVMLDLYCDSLAMKQFEDFLWMEFTSKVNIQYYYLFSPRGGLAAH